MRRGNVATFIFVFIPNANGGQSIITTRTQIDIPSTPSQTSSALPSLAGDPSLWSSPTDSTSDVSEYFRRVAVKQGLREDFFVRHEGASDVDGEGIGEGNSDLNSNAESVPPFELGSPLLPASSAPEHPASDDDDLYDASVTGSPPMIPASRQLSASAILSPPRNVGDHPSSILPDSADAVAAEVKQEETAKRPKYNTLTAQELEWERENAIFAEAQARLDAVPRYPLILSEARALVAASPSELTSLRRILTTAPPAFPTTPMTLTASPPTLAARAPTLGAAPPALAITPMTLTASPPTLATTPPTLMTSSPALVATPPTLTATPLYLTLTPSPPTMAADVPTLSATASPPTRAPRSPEYYIAAKETLDDKQAAREAAYKSSN